MSKEIARTIANAFATSLFDGNGHGYNAKNNAQRNLSGRTHYVDDSTLRCFFSRIISTAETDNGLVFMLVESVAGDYQNRSRGFRFVAFDITGTIINERASASKETLFRSSEKASKAMWEWADEFNAMAHYKALLAERGNRMKAQAGTMIALSRKLKI